MRARNITGRSRKSLAWGFGLFVALQVGLAIAIELWLPEWRDPLYGDKLKQLRRAIASRQADAPLVVMLGSSRTINGLDAAGLERQLASRRGVPALVYNFGIPGAGPITELVNLKRLLKEGIRPDLVLIEVMPAMLAGQTPPFDYCQFPADRVWLHEVPLVAHYTKASPYAATLERDWWTGRLAVWYTHRFSIIRSLAPRLMPPEGRTHLLATFDQRGWNRLEDTLRTPERFQKGFEHARREYGKVLKEFKLGGPSCEALEELLRTCRQQGIGSVLVIMPEGGEFRSCYPPGVWDQVEGYLVSLADRDGVELINAHEWIPDSGFLDSHHLLQRGSQRFTRRLNRHLTFHGTRWADAQPTRSALHR